MFLSSNGTGVYDVPEVHSLIRKGIWIRKKSRTVERSFWVKPKKDQSLSIGCYGSGKEYLIYYPNFVLNTGKNAKGVEVILSVLNN